MSAEIIHVDFTVRLRIDAPVAPQTVAGQMVKLSGELGASLRWLGASIGRLRSARGAPESA